MALKNIALIISVVLILPGCARHEPRKLKALEAAGAPTVQQPSYEPSQQEQPAQQPSEEIKPLTHAEREFVVYAGAGAGGNHYIPSGWMGDYTDITLNDGYKGNCLSKQGCMQFVYNSKKGQGQGWAGVYWQNPANNWGDAKGGYDLAGMDRLTFWARGEKGTEKIDKFIVGGIKGRFPDSSATEIDSIELTASWREYSIDLKGKDLSYINGGFGWAASADMNPEGCTFYLDEIKFEGGAQKTEGQK